jgi:hypothetical protein
MLQVMQVAFHLPVLKLPPSLWFILDLTTVCTHTLSPSRWNPTIPWSAHAVFANMLARTFDDVVMKCYVTPVLYRW